MFRIVLPLKKMVMTKSVIFGSVMFGALVVGVFLYIRSQPLNEVNAHIPAGYAFTYKEDALPQEKLLSEENISPNSSLSGRIEHALISADPMRGTFACKNVGSASSTYEPIRVPYFKFAPGRMYGVSRVVGGWRERYAVVCGSEYFVVDAADSTGFKMYGPFGKR
jgi:hypothetical protein